jgi:hypothetical protein
MPFSVNLITLASEADALIALANRDKRGLEVRKQNLAYRTENVAERIDELKETQAQLDSTIAAINALPDGERKEDEITKKLELELKIRRLSRSGISTVAKLENQYDIELIDRQIAGIDAFIDELTARKAQL